jgi:uncharacterized protein (TIGR03437 family)
VTDSAGVTRPAQIFYSSANLINYRLPPDTATGFGSVTIAANGTQSSGNINVAPVYPNLFLQSSDALPAAYIVRASGGAITTEVVSAAAIDLGAGADQVFLVLAATGLGKATSATVSIAGITIQAAYAGPQGGYPGLDQINILIPPSLAGSGKVDIVVTAGGKNSNVVYINLK